MNLARTLFIEYQQWLGVDLCFQDFQAELDSLPGAYAPPKGVLILAYLERELVGCVAVRPLKEQGACEMKRLYVRPQGRGMGIGLGLARRALREGQKMGYSVMKLDTLARMDSAIKLYEGLGFRATKAYCKNPLDDVVYMERPLV